MGGGTNQSREACGGGCQGYATGGVRHSRAGRNRFAGRYSAAGSARGALHATEHDYRCPDGGSGGAVESHAKTGETTPDCCRRILRFARRAGGAARLCGILERAGCRLISSP